MLVGLSALIPTAAVTVIFAMPQAEGARLLVHAEFDAHCLFRALVGAAADDQTVTVRLSVITKSGAIDGAIERIAAIISDLRTTGRQNQ